MPTSLVIVESPAKCKKIETYLGPGFKVIASFGHLRTISGLKSIDINNDTIKERLDGLCDINNEWFISWD